jgi:hypothetical protein
MSDRTDEYKFTMFRRKVLPPFAEYNILLFYPEEGGSMLLLTVHKVLPDYTAAEDSITYILSAFRFVQIRSLLHHGNFQRSSSNLIPWNTMIAICVNCFNIQDPRIFSA